MKKKIFLIVLVVALVLIAANMGTIIFKIENEFKNYNETKEAKEKLLILSNWSNDIKEYDKNNYHMKITFTFNGMFSCAYETYRKDDKILVTQKDKDGKIIDLKYRDSINGIDCFRRMDGQIVAEVYEQEDDNYFENENYLRNDLMYAIPEKYDNLDSIDFLNKNIYESIDALKNMEIYKTGLKGKEIYICTNVIDSTTFLYYVDKETGLLLYESAVRSSNYPYAIYSVGSEGGLIPDGKGYYYEFGTVTDEDVQKPDISNYIVLQ